jgi:hypothetical protein
LYFNKKLAAPMAEQDVGLVYAEDVPRVHAVMLRNANVMASLELVRSDNAKANAWSQISHVRGRPTRLHLRDLVGLKFDSTSVKEIWNLKFLLLELVRRN